MSNKYQRTMILLSVILFLVEVVIGRFAHGVIRSYGGDVLVVILLYTIAQSIRKMPPLPTIAAIFGISVVVEITQYFHLSKLLGFADSSLPAIIMGTNFSFADILSYAIGCIAVVVAVHYSPDRGCA